MANRPITEQDILDRGFHLHKQSSELHTSDKKMYVFGSNWYLIANFKTNNFILSTTKDYFDEILNNYTEFDELMNKFNFRLDNLWQRRKVRRLKD